MKSYPYKRLEKEESYPYKRLEKEESYSARDIGIIFDFVYLTLGDGITRLTLGNSVTQLTLKHEIYLAS